MSTEKVDNGESPKYNLSKQVYINGFLKMGRPFLFWAAADAQGILQKRQKEHLRLPGHTEEGRENAAVLHGKCPVFRRCIFLRKKGNKSKGAEESNFSRLHNGRGIFKREEK